MLYIKFSFIYVHIVSTTWKISNLRGDTQKLVHNLFSYMNLI
jgi:hypothetical protein